jgi:hypothetical protein
MVSWWWPSDDDRDTWPPGVPREETVAAFTAAFRTLGYDVALNESLEAGVEKIALFALAADRPTHATRQLSDGRWTSKLGELADIEHDLRDLEGTAYGTVAVVLARPTGVTS